MDVIAYGTKGKPGDIWVPDMFKIADAGSAPVRVELKPHGFPAIPWTEMPEVKARLDAGQTIKFSFRVNDNAGGGCMELSRGRSVAKRNGSFLADWVEHWANEVEFGLER